MGVIFSMLPGRYELYQVDGSYILFVTR